MTRRKLVISVLIISILLTLSLISNPLYATNPQKKAKLKSKLNTVEKKIKTIKIKIEQKKHEKRVSLAQLAVTEDKLESAQAKVSQNKLNLLRAQSDLGIINIRLQRTKRLLVRRQKLLARRIVDIYEGDDLSYVNVILGSTDMWSFLTRSYYLKQILNADTELIDQIKTNKTQIESDKKRQAKRVVQIASLQMGLIQQRNEASDLTQERRDQLTAIEHDKELYEKALDELEQESQDIEAQIRRTESVAHGRFAYNKTFKGGLMMPVRGRFSSRFGFRRHPITGVYKLHTGLDISARNGTPISAAADGVVIFSRRMRAYGNAVVISHGGGVSTLYGHCSRLLVKVGQEVKKGQTIALVGSTGYSTGPHCHFEKRINGTPVNPM